MGVYYTCRHCQTCLGIIPNELVRFDMLGFDRLTVDDRKELLMIDPLGNIHVKITCEDCEEALHYNPSLHEIDYIIQ